MVSTVTTDSRRRVPHQLPPFHRVRSGILPRPGTAARITPRPTHGFLHRWGNFRESAGRRGVWRRTVRAVYSMFVETLVRRRATEESKWSRLLRIPEPGQREGGASHIFRSAASSTALRQGRRVPSTRKRSCAHVGCWLRNARKPPPLQSARWPSADPRHRRRIQQGNVGVAPSETRGRPGGSGPLTDATRNRSRRSERARSRLEAGDRLEAGMRRPP
jgi:hypothetical protein